MLHDAAAHRRPLGASPGFWAISSLERTVSAEDFGGRPQRRAYGVPDGGQAILRVEYGVLGRINGRD